MRGSFLRTCLSLAVLASAVAGIGCATYEQELGRAEEHFTHDEHEKALAGLRALELDWSALETRDRARYCYLRGMTDYRIGYKADARHWLIVAKALEGQTPNSLPADWKTTMNERIKELNEEVFGGGVESLANVKKAAKSTDEPPPKKNSEEP